MNKFWSRETSRSWSRQAWCQTASASVLQRYGVEIADPEVDGLTGPRWWELRSTFKTAEKCKRTHATILQTHTIPVFHSQDRTHRDCKQDSALTTLDHVQFSTWDATCWTLNMLETADCLNHNHQKIVLLKYSWDHWAMPPSQTYHTWTRTIQAANICIEMLHSRWSKRSSLTQFWYI